MCIYIYLELFVLYGDAVYFCCHYNPSLSNTKGLFYLNMLMLQAFMWSRDATSLLTGGGGLISPFQKAGGIHTLWEEVMPGRRSSGQKQPPQQSVGS